MEVFLAAGADSLEIMIDALGQGSRLVRRTAAEIVGQLGGKARGAGAALMSLSEGDEFSDVRAAAAEARRRIDAGPGE